jgi:hypothetical protein
MVVLILTLPISEFGVCSCGFLVYLRLCTKKPSFPHSLVQVGILHQKSSSTLGGEIVKVTVQFGPTRISDGPSSNSSSEMFALLFRIV